MDIEDKYVSINSPLKQEEIIKSFISYCCGVYVWSL